MEIKLDVLPIPDTVNRNGHYYSHEVLEKAMVKFQEKIKNKPVPVTLGQIKPDIDGKYAFEKDSEQDPPNTIGYLESIELSGNRYVAITRFTRPTKEVLSIIENAPKYSIGLNKTGNIDKDKNVYDINIINGSIIMQDGEDILDDKISELFNVAVDDNDLQYFLNKFLKCKHDTRSRNQLITLIDASYAKAKVEHEQEKN